MTNRWKVDRLWMKRTVKDFIFYALKSLWMVSAAMKFKDTASWKKSPNKPSSVQFNSVAQLCLTLCDPMNHSMPGFPVHHQLPESTQTHVHWVGDAIQPSHPLLSPSPPALNLSQHQVFSNESDLDSVLKNRDTTSPTKVHMIKAMVFPVVSMDMRVGP